MAIYCVLTRTDTDWGEQSDRFNTRAAADQRLKELLADGLQPRLIRWEDNTPKEMQPVPRDDASTVPSSVSSQEPSPVAVVDQSALATMYVESLAHFVREQFRRIDRWCWDTVIEVVAASHEIPLNADRLTYAGGTIRTGPYRFRTNNAKWRAFCQRMQTDDDEVMRLLAQVEAALRSPNALGVADSWRQLIESRIPVDEGGHAEYARRLLRWDGHFYRGPRDCSPCVDAYESVIYGLWRLDEQGKPIQPFPLYVGEGSGTARDRLDDSHRKWWGDGKPIGVTVLAVAPEERVQIEQAVIRMLLPFCNIKGRCFDELERAWTFPRPS